MPESTSKYKPEYAEQTKKLCLLGATDKELADFFNVCEDTIYEWKKKHEAFSEAIKSGKELADAEIATKLYYRAKGYDCKATKFATHEGVITDSVDYVEHYPPDTTAAIFWLKNRQPKKWRDKQDHEITGTLGVTIVDDVK
jgi:hypothetical protein